MLIIPVRLPIAIPVGHKDVTLIFEDDRLVQWIIIDDHWCITSLGFNFIPMDPEGKSVGFFYETSCEWGHRGVDPYSAKCDFLFYKGCYPTKY